MRGIQNKYIGNSIICSDIWHKHHERYFEIVIRNFTSSQASEIWDNFEISRVVFVQNITCLYYYPQMVCNFHMQVFQIKLKYLYSQPIKLHKIFDVVAVARELARLFTSSTRSPKFLSAGKPWGRGSCWRNQTNVLH